MAAKKASKAASFTWANAVVGMEGTPLLLADAPVYRRRTGDEGDGPADVVDVVDFGEHHVVLLDTEGGGSADVGYSDEETLVVLATSDITDDPKKRAKLAKRIEAKKDPEYLVGEIELTVGLVVADGASSGADAPEVLGAEAGPVGGGRWFLPRAPGRYTVVEGHFDGDGDGEARWCRITPHGSAAYVRRPAEVKKDPVEEVLARISFDTPVTEARALEAALTLVELGRPDLALDVCAKASEARRALASWTRIFALAAQKAPAAQEEAIALAASWLAPASDATAPNQVLPRPQFLRALGAAAAQGENAALAAIRAKVEAAPEPEVFVAETGDFF